MIEYTDTFTENTGPGYYQDIDFDNINIEEKLPEIFIDEEFENDE